MRCIGNCDICGRCRCKSIKSNKGKVVLPEYFIPEYSKDDEYAVSVDIGTTTLAFALWQLNTANLTYCMSVLNPQTKYCHDIVSRIRFDINNRGILHKEIINCINNAINDIIKKTGINKITKISVCANTVMSHIFLDIPLDTMAQAPFKPVFYYKEPFSAKDTGININAEIYLMPNIESFVGSDTVSSILASGMTEKDEISLMADFGTNAEIALYKDKQLYVCSASAGPAFEGGTIKCGMKASDGAVEGISFKNKDIALEVIGNCKPCGLCGSGIIDTAAKLHIIGIIDENGRILNRSELSGINSSLISRIKENDIDTEFVLSENVSIYQSDIRALQLAKSAVYTAILTLLDITGTEIADVDKLYITGSFGSSINKKSAYNIKLIPICESKTVMADNLASVGAAMYILSQKSAESACTIAKGAIHVELSQNKYFNNNYIDNMGL